MIRLLGGGLVVCEECYNLGLIGRLLLFCLPLLRSIFLIFFKTNLLTYIQNNTSNELVRLVMGTTFLVKSLWEEWYSMYAALSFANYFYTEYSILKTKDL